MRGATKMYEIYNKNTNEVVLSGLTYKQATALRLTWGNRFDFWIRPMS